MLPTNLDPEACLFRGEGCIDLGEVDNVPEPLNFRIPVVAGMVQSPTA